jgi:hypothetical protein
VKEQTSLRPHNKDARVVSTNFVVLRIWNVVPKNSVRFCQSYIRLHVWHLSEHTGQINVCWSTLNNPVASLNATLFNQTFRILSSANPSAASYLVVDVRQIALPTASASRSPSSSIASISSTVTPLDTSSPTPSNSPTDNGTSGISGSAIGGIVGGVAGGLVLLGIAGWLLWRRRRNGHHEVAQHDVPELSAEDTMYAQMKSGGDITELSSEGKPMELEHPPVELDATERSTGTEDRR